MKLLPVWTKDTQWLGLLWSTIISVKCFWPMDLVVAIETHKWQCGWQLCNINLNYFLWPCSQIFSVLVCVCVYSVSSGSQGCCSRCCPACAAIRPPHTWHSFCSGWTSTSTSQVLYLPCLPSPQNDPVEWLFLSQLLKYHCKMYKICCCFIIPCL